ncbi:hypothetical protein TNCV_4329211 [Trichonephila clavipes]|nr:hypothetical protein TNCV_4329211 [Trichonephila clavipes]
MHFQASTKRRGLHLSLHSNFITFSPCQRKDFEPRQISHASASLHWRWFQNHDHDLANAAACVNWNSILSSVESDLGVSLVNNGLVGPYSATVLVILPSAPDHRPPRLASVC